MKYLSNIFYGQNKTCSGVIKGYKQQVVLINKSDVESFKIESELVENGVLEPLAKHRIQFKLFDGKSGFLIENNRNSSIVVPNVNATYSDELPRYTHTIQFGIYDITERTKWLLLSLTKAEYFACVLHNSGVVEVYGFEFGLKPDGYTFDASDGGGIIKLSSIENEFSLPYNYQSPRNTPVKDFEHQFDLTKDVSAYNKGFNKGFRA